MSGHITKRLVPLPAVAGLALSASAYAETAVPAGPDAQASNPATHPVPRGPTARQSAPRQNDEHIDVVGHRFNTLLTGNGLSRMPQDVLHTAQNINVIPQELMRQQNVKSVDEALRDVPGVTSSIGEGAGGMNGDQFLIRGFPAQNDIYEDGLRDFGVYSRDAFNLETISVIKGPSSEVFGNGTTGGAINMITKVPLLDNLYQAEFSGGSGSYYRGSLDFNQRLDPTTAFRIQAVGNSNDIVGRDRIFSHRWGVAPSLTFGLGQRTTLTLQYMHQQEDSVPDFGVPVVRKPGTPFGEPITEYGIRRSNWYGTRADHNATSDNMETARFTHRLNDNVTFYDDLRGGEFYRSFAASKATCDATCTARYFGSDPDSALVARSGPVGAGAGKGPGTYFAPLPYDQRSWSVQNVASMLANFHTWFLRHQLVTGFDIERVNDVRGQSTYLRPKPYANLVHPDPNVGDLRLVPGDANPAGLVSLGALGAKADSNGYGFDTGIFFADQVWFTKWLSVKGGFRWDRWQTAYNVTGGDVATNPDSHLDNVTNVINPNVSLLFTPDEHQTYYFTWSSSSTPAGMYVTNGSVPIRPPGGAIADPEKARLYEVGAKYSALHDRLGLTASLFRLEKSNAIQADPVTGLVSSTGDEQRNQGLELSANGMILPHWNVSATYAYYDSETTSSLTRANVGRNVPYVPRNQVTFWSVYEAAAGTPYNLAFGGGVTWRDGVWLDSANTARVPYTLSVDAMLAHRFGSHWRLALNAYNLTNRLNYQSLFVNRATPSAGRTFLGQISMTY